MKPAIEWAEDWEIGVNQARETEVTLGVLEMFVDFWVEESIGDKSKSTVNRYRAALQSLGSYIVEQSISEEGLDLKIEELILGCIDEEGGPFLFQDEETWQSELDMVCRKLHKYFRRKHKK